MFNLKNTFLKMFFKFEVLSDLPGRLRLKVKNFKKIPEGALQYENYAIDVLSRLDGIENIKFNFVIGTVLIQYDKNKLNSEKIIQYLNSVKKLILDNINLINYLEGKSEEQIAKILFEILDDFIEKNYL